MGEGSSDFGEKPTRVVVLSSNTVFPYKKCVGGRGDTAGAGIFPALGRFSEHIMVVRICSMSR